MSDYIQRLFAAGVTLISPLGHVKDHHEMRCNICHNVFDATPISITQVFKKWGTNGCAVCNRRRQEAVKATIRVNNMQKLNDRGLEIISDWNGTTGAGKSSVPINVTVKNTHCGHTFTSSSKNLLTRGVECPICARTLKTNNINHWSELNSARWRQTATDWQRYKSTVTKQTRISYIANKHIINPNSLPTGKAGVEGAYHIDHIVPIRYCYDHQIPEELCSHHTNLQMLGWRENVGSRDKLKENVCVPELIQQYLNENKYIFDWIDCETTRSAEN